MIYFLLFPATTTSFGGDEIGATPRCVFVIGQSGSGFDFVDLMDLLRFVVLGF